MNKYFGIHLEFDPLTVHSTLDGLIETKNKGYICVVDGNVMAMTRKREDYREIVNRADVNLCDGSSIAKMAGVIHGKKLSSYTGPDLFCSYIRKPLRHIIIGNTEENRTKLQEKLIREGYDHTINTVALPFQGVDEFDYEEIAGEVNSFEPDIIWVSLGAPKQEIFIGNLYPYIEQGVLIAIGAAINMFAGGKKNRRSPDLFRKLHMEWLYRVAQEPKRIGKRAWGYFKVIPGMVISELKTKNVENKQNKI